MSLRLRKKLFNPLCAHTYINLYKRSATLIEERHTRLPCNRFGDHRFTHTWRTYKKHAFWKGYAITFVACGVFKKVHDLFKFFFDIFDACNISKTHLCTNWTNDATHKRIIACISLLVVVLFFFKIFCAFFACINKQCKQ